MFEFCQRKLEISPPSEDFSLNLWAHKTVMGWAIVSGPFLSGFLVSSFEAEWEENEELNLRST